MILKIYLDNYQFYLFQHMLSFYLLNHLYIRLKNKVWNNKNRKINIRKK